MTRRWAVVATATACLLAPFADRGRHRSAIAFGRPGSPARLAVFAQPRLGCRGAVDQADPMAVAGAVAAAIYCGTAPVGTLSQHGRQVLASWASLIGDRSPAAVTTLAIPDPRAAPVVVYAVVRSRSDPDPCRVVLTLYPTPAGGWIVDDIAAVGG